jgi:hypothetical protein
MSAPARLLDVYRTCRINGVPATYTEMAAWHVALSTATPLRAALQLAALLEARVRPLLTPLAVWSRA